LAQPANRHSPDLSILKKPKQWIYARGQANKEKEVEQGNKPA
jgi:hypothetical protein